MSTASSRYYYKNKAEGKCPRCGNERDCKTSYCSSCRIKQNSNPLKRRVRNYRLTVEQYNKQLEKQEHKCSICREYMLKPCIDHNHNTKQVRELLCRKCNSCLGLMEENILYLENMIAYIKRHN